MREVQVEELAPPEGPLFEQCRARKKKLVGMAEAPSPHVVLSARWRACACMPIEIGSVHACLRGLVKDHGNRNASVSLLSNSLGKQAAACNFGSTVRFYRFV